MKPKSSKSSGEEAFLWHWRTLIGEPMPEREFVIHPSRRFRFDFAWPSQKVAVEIEGGTWAKGRHVSGAGYERDCIKYNLAQYLGWRVLRYTTTMVRKDPVRTIKQVATLVCQKPHHAVWNIEGGIE